MSQAPLDHTEIDVSAKTKWMVDTLGIALHTKVVLGVTGKCSFYSFLLHIFIHVADFFFRKRSNLLTAVKEFCTAL